MITAKNTVQLSRIKDITLESLDKPCSNNQTIEPLGFNLLNVYYGEKLY